MLNLLPVILLLCSGSVLAAALGRRAEEAMPLTAGGLIVLLYLFYAADRLAWGYWTAVVLCCGCHAGAIFLIVQRGGSFRLPCAAVYAGHGGLFDALCGRLAAGAGKHGQRMG